MWLSGEGRVVLQEIIAEPDSENQVSVKRMFKTNQAERMRARVSLRKKPSAHQREDDCKVVAEDHVQPRENQRAGQKRRFHPREEAVVSPGEERAVEQLLRIDRSYRIDREQRGPSLRRRARELEQPFRKERQHQREERDRANRKSKQDIFQLPPFGLGGVAAPEMFDPEITAARKPDGRHCGDRAEKEHPEPGAEDPARN